MDNIFYTQKAKFVGWKKLKVVNLILNGQYLLQYRCNKTRKRKWPVVNLILNGQYLLRGEKEAKEILNMRRKPYSKWTISSTLKHQLKKHWQTCRKPYSKWTISSTKITIAKEFLCFSCRKPYSKWTISSTRIENKGNVSIFRVVNLILNGQYLLLMY